MAGKKFASTQEEILHAMSEFSLGSDFLFTPENYGNDEPCDLAWLCGDIAVLFWCTSLTRSYAKANQHNLRQAKTWIGRWRRGQVLKGKNALREFSAVAHDFKTIVALSIVSTADARAEVHKALGEKHSAGVAVLFATLPEAVVVRLANIGAGLRDFLAVLTAVADAGGSLDEAAIQAWLNDYLAERFGRLGFPIPEDQPFSGFNYGIAIVQASRRQGNGMSLPMIDLDMFDTLWLATRIEHHVSRLAPPGQFGLLLSGEEKPGPPFHMEVRCFGNIEVMRRWVEQQFVPPGGKNMKLQLLIYMLGDALGGMAILPESETLPSCRTAADLLANRISLLP